MSAFRQNFYDTCNCKFCIILRSISHLHKFSNISHIHTWNRGSNIKLQNFLHEIYLNLRKILNKGNAKRGVSPLLKIWPCDFDLWPWKSIGFQTLIRTKYVSSLVKIHWRMLILECSQGCYVIKIWSGDLDLWPWKSIRFQILLSTKYVPSLVKIHWRMLFLECPQGCYGRTDGSITTCISLRNFVGEAINSNARWTPCISIFWICSRNAARDNVWI
jgi:hypothetical protein